MSSTGWWCTYLVVAFVPVGDWLRCCDFYSVGATNSCMYLVQAAGSARPLGAYWVYGWISNGSQIPLPQLCLGLRAGVTSLFVKIHIWIMSFLSLNKLIRKGITVLYKGPCLVGGSVDTVGQHFYSVIYNTWWCGPQGHNVINILI